MKVTLKFAHTHAGVKYKAGDKVDLPLMDALWLKAEDLVEEGIADVKAEVNKLTGKDKQAHQAALDKAVTADAARQPAASATPASTGSKPAS